MGVIRDISQLHVQVQPLALGFLSECEHRGYSVLVLETRREKPVSDAYYAQGRGGLVTVNALRAKAGLAAISNKENQKKITKAKYGMSWHNYGCALDFVPLMAGKKPDWDYDPNDPLDLWDEIAAVAQTFGFKWGKSFYDYPHIDYHPGWTSVTKACEWMKAHNEPWSLPLQS